MKKYMHTTLMTACLLCLGLLLTPAAYASHGGGGGGGNGGASDAVGMGGGGSSMKSPADVAVSFKHMAPAKQSEPSSSYRGSTISKKDFDKVVDVFQADDKSAATKANAAAIEAHIEVLGKAIEAVEVTHGVGGQDVDTTITFVSLPLVVTTPAGGKEDAVTGSATKNVHTSKHSDAAFSAATSAVAAPSRSHVTKTQERAAAAAAKALAKVGIKPSPGQTASQAISKAAAVVGARNMIPTPNYISK